ncbi:hypothetical protein EV356DRAFT_571875 [Viridothelium virens]|uniref:Uncharacterized protein n=1 Tax=Viridothelium virens TaxID=1048519 RepID=A0A6A6GRV6_VIRVR|nr:hypothetical protein EV356DRAFT_571875 [Viridothelium virens]
MSSSSSEGSDDDRVTGISTGGKDMTCENRAEEAVPSSRATGPVGDSAIGCKLDSNKKTLNEGDGAIDDNTVTDSGTVARKSESEAGTRTRKRKRNRRSVMSSILSEYQELRKRLVPIAEAAAQNMIPTTSEFDFVPFFQNGCQVKTFFHAAEYGDDDEWGAIIYLEGKKVLLAKISIAMLAHLNTVIDLMDSVTNAVGRIL